jgi:transcriptional regulator with XRE-family HTH domain
MGDRQELGGFLRTRRARVTPESAGLRAGSRRRVPGLRREELAQLAGISVEYYQRLEQGRANHPSDEVLDAIARVLRLDEVERDHLHRLVGRPARGLQSRSVPVRAELRRMLDLVAVPAMVVNDRFDVLSLNPIAERLFAPVGTSNLARFLFLTPEGRDFYVEWDDVAAATAGQLQVAVGRHPHDDGLAELVRELAAGSDTFRELWARRDVEVRTHGAKSFRHAAVGTLTFTYENFDLAGDVRQRLITFTPAAGATEAALQLLASWATPAGPTPAGPTPTGPNAAVPDLDGRVRR